MPHLISKDEAMASLPTGSACFLCEMLESTDNIFSDDQVSVVLSRYPRFWGQVMVVLNRHITDFRTITDHEWIAMNVHALKAARILEEVLDPVRCHIASIGTERADLPMTSPHLHINVLPIPEEDLRPSEIYTWTHGVYAGTEEEWEALHTAIRSNWN